MDGDHRVEIVDWKRKVTHLGSRAEERLDELRRHLRRKAGWSDPLKVLPYRGYGTRHRFWLRGRVLEDRGVDEPEVGESALENIHRMLRRYASREQPGARLKATYGRREVEVVCDDEGYFELDLDGVEAPDDGSDDRWQAVDLELLEPLRAGQEPFCTQGPVLVPPEGAELCVVSDVDDTIMETGATDHQRHVKTVLLNSARSRTAFPGVGAFYRALECGMDDRPVNPVFYVSSSPWNLYELFEGFLELRELPLGPLFLKDFGLEPGKLFKSGHGEHKIRCVETLMETYPDLSFVLIGDSGQRDAEIYREVVRRQPERVEAVYLRDVSKDLRDEEVREIIAEIEDHGVAAVFAEDTRDAAANAVERGLIRPEALDEIDREAREDEEG